jgi:hypothetical protein
MVPHMENSSSYSHIPRLITAPNGQSHSVYFEQAASPAPSGTTTYHMSCGQQLMLISPNGNLTGNQHYIIMNNPLSSASLPLIQSENTPTHSAAASTTTLKRKRPSRSCKEVKVVTPGRAGNSQRKRVLPARLSPARPKREILPKPDHQMVSQMIYTDSSSHVQYILQQTPTSENQQGVTSVNSLGQHISSFIPQQLIYTTDYKQ